MYLPLNLFPYVINDLTLDLKGPLENRMKEMPLPNNSPDILHSLASFMLYLSEYDLSFIHKDNRVKMTLLQLLEQLG